jgi:hypothetical protein
MTMKNDAESISLELVHDMQGELRDALTSLAGKKRNGLLDNFVVYMAKYIDMAGDAYISLRRASKLDASKLLIRPSIEAAIQILAVQKKPDLLYRIAYTARMQDRKLVRPSAIKSGWNYDADDNKRWDQFEQRYRAHFPNHALDEKELLLIDAATTAGVGWYYDVYRLYSRFTHAALTAATGALNYTDNDDNCHMAACVCCGLEAVAAAGAAPPNLDSFRRRLSALGESGGDKQNN